MRLLPLVLAGSVWLVGCGGSGSDPMVDAGTADDGGPGDASLPDAGADAGADSGPGPDGGTDSGPDPDAGPAPGRVECTEPEELTWGVSPSLSGRRIAFLRDNGFMTPDWGRYPRMDVLVYDLDDEHMELAHTTADEAIAWNVQLQGPVLIFRELAYPADDQLILVHAGDDGRFGTGDAHERKVILARGPYHEGGPGGWGSVGPGRLLVHGDRVLVAWSEIGERSVTEVLCDVALDGSGGTCLEGGATRLVTERRDYHVAYEGFVTPFVRDGEPAVVWSQQSPTSGAFEVWLGHGDTVEPWLARPDRDYLVSDAAEDTVVVQERASAETDSSISVLHDGEPSTRAVSTLEGGSLDRWAEIDDDAPGLVVWQREPVLAAPDDMSASVGVGTGAGHTPVLFAPSRDQRFDEATVSGDLVAFTRWTNPAGPTAMILTAHCQVVED